MGVVGPAPSPKQSRVVDREPISARSVAVADTGSNRRDPRVGVWASAPVLADVGGWNSAGFYESLRVGDVDGDGADEVFIRGGKVLEVLDDGAADGGTLTPTLWTVHVSQPLLPSSWQRADNYRIFTRGDVDGDGDEEVLGRDPYGVRTFDYQDGALVPAVTPFPAFSGAECTAYAAIAQANADVLDGDDLRAAYGDPGVVVADLEVPSTRPSGVSAAAWATVAPQIAREIAAAKSVRTWHVGTNGMTSVITQGYSTQLASMDSISAYFQTKRETATGEVFPRLEGVAEAIGLVAERESITGDLVAAGITSILTFTNNELSRSDDTQVTLTKSKLAGQIARMRQQATNANAQNETYVPREYGLMFAMQGAKQPGALAPWQTMWRQSDIYFWQTFAAEFWNASYCDGLVTAVLAPKIRCATLVFDTSVAFTQFPMKGAWQRSDAEAYWMGVGSSTVTQSKSFRERTNGTPAARHVIFGTAPKACQPPLTNASDYPTGCRLGLDPADVSLGRNGWGLSTYQLTTVA